MDTKDRIEFKKYEENLKNIRKIAKKYNINLDNKQIGGDHYKLPIQPIEYIVKNNLGYREGNVIKYVTRYKNKGGVEDIKKAIHYLEMILEDYVKDHKQK